MAAKVTKTTPMVQQYMDIKQEYQDCLLFFRLGDFYEMFYEDAVVASRELEIVLTSRGDSGTERIPMCGVPYHSVSGYLAKLLSKGYKVAICEQVEDPKTAKGIVKRAVVRVVTPGTIIEEQLLREKVNNYLAAISYIDQAWGLAYVDLSTGEFKVTQIPSSQSQLLMTELIRIKPAELYITETNSAAIPGLSQLSELVVTHGAPGDFRYETAYARLTEHFQIHSLRAFGCEELPAAVSAAGGVLAYLYETQKNSLIHLRKIVTYETGQFMTLDPATRRNLELTRTFRAGDTSGSLFAILDYTVTSMGGRTLRTWLEQPLVQLAAITRRQAAVAALTVNLEARESIRELLKNTYDIQRILSKLASNSANARDLLGLKNTLQELPKLKELLKQFSVEYIKEIEQNIFSCTELSTLLIDALLEDPPLTIKEGGIINPSFHPELAHLKDASSQGRRWVAELEQQERERTGIKSLKIGFNQVFGYYIEVTNSNLNMVPADYIRKQTLTNGERFINQTLKEYEDLILNAHEKSVALEYQIFLEIREKILQHIDELQQTATSLAELDSILSLAEVAVRNHYIKPELNENGKIVIIDGRHPVVERMIPPGNFVPNDVLLDSNDNRTHIITGPNMAGKSTYMRQVALIVLLAHIGSFVPAKSAQIGLVDRIFTRVGASDDLATGQSTFMVEMNEVAYILNHATAKSLIILDEIGRGTSTFDGMSIAWAVVEFVNHPNRIGAKTLVATHYHELTELASILDGVKNYHVAVQRDGEEIVFIRKIMPGKTDQSYGIEVARLAGLPTEITNRAREILKMLEKHQTADLETPVKPPVSETERQLSLFPMDSEVVLEELRKMDLVSITPLQALNLLYEWQQKLRGQQAS
jgi:DNA mismatch repair protein MutS